MKANTAKIMRVLHEVKVQDGLELHEETYQGINPAEFLSSFIYINPSHIANH